MLTTLLGRFFRHCIKNARNRELRVIVNQYDPDYMTDQEISHFLYNRCHLIDWELVRRRRKDGDKQAPWFPPTASGIGA